jgi:hypothetical protein
MDASSDEGNVVIETAWLTRTDLELHDLAATYDEMDTGPGAAS